MTSSLILTFVVPTLISSLIVMIIIYTYFEHKFDCELRENGIDRDEFADYLMKQKALEKANKAYKRNR